MYVGWHTKSTNEAKKRYFNSLQTLIIISTVFSCCLTLLYPTICIWGSLYSWVGMTKWIGICFPLAEINSYRRYQMSSQSTVRTFDFTWYNNSGDISKMPSVRTTICFGLYKNDFRIASVSMDEPPYVRMHCNHKFKSSLAWAFMA